MRADRVWYDVAYLHQHRPVITMYVLLRPTEDGYDVLGLYDNEERAEEAKKFFPKVDKDDFEIKEYEVNKMYATKEDQMLYYCRKDKLSKNIGVILVDPTYTWLENSGQVNFTTGETSRDVKEDGLCFSVVLWAKDKSEAKRVFMQMLGEGNSGSR
jgi:hypothetical protein